MFRDFASGNRLLARRLLILAAVVVVMAAWVPAARAAWSAPVTVSAPHSWIDSLQLASGPYGDLLAWRYEDLIVAKGIFGPSGARYAVAPPGGSFGPERQLPNRYASGPLVNLGGGLFAQVILKPHGLNLSTPSVTIDRVDGTFVAPLPIHGSVFANRISVAGNARGDLLASWISADAHGGHRVVFASVRFAGGRFGAPQVMSDRGAPEQVRAAIGARRDMIVTFDSGQARGQLLARVRRAGHSWGPIQHLGPAAVGTENDVTPYAGNYGGFVVAWYHTQLCEGGCLSPGYTDVAVQASNRNRFRPAQLLERDPIGLAGAPIGRSLAPAVAAHGAMIAFLAAGRAAAGAVPTPAVVKVAYFHGTQFTRRETVSPPNEQASDLTVATGRSGQMLTWIRDDPPSYGDGTVFAAVRLPNTGFYPGFAPPEQVSPTEHVSSVLATFNIASHWPQNSISPWTVAWVSNPGREGPAGKVQALVRVSTPICPIPTSIPAPPPTPDPACVGPN